MTKAVVAKGKKRTESKETLCPPNKPTSILGCWVINHTHQARKSGKYVEVSGKFDVNVWYSHSNHSKTSVFTETISYKDRIRLHYRDEPTSRHEEVLVNVIQHPNCTEAIISKCGEKFVICVERELIAEVIGETKICVTVHPHTFEEEWPIRDESSSHHHGQHHDHKDKHQDHGKGHGHGHKDDHHHGHGRKD
ncbi:outer spore coat protein CotE [Sporosarcina ureilytica]|uniref:outer spore coat protein CotE n=1 Tax=Sporosarcina ureilytica TaxID=298596 RepID=UPI001FE10D7B|nr:outer spore coat protein CotE [Sporosarcina ureilytica]